MSHIPYSNDLVTMKGLSILLDYLTETAVAPLRAELVEIDDPWCNGVEFQVFENTVAGFTINLTNVPTERLDGIKDKSVLCA